MECFRRIATLLLTGTVCCFLYAGSHESEIALDGAGRWTFGGLSRSALWSWSLNYRLDPRDTDTVLPGINGPFLSIGHLGDTGLAAEIRNPGYDALPRLMERTRYSADLRSVSPSRLGAALFLPGNGLGIVLEKRESGESLQLWAALPLGNAAGLEGIVQLARAEGDGAAESWYVDEPGMPAGWHLSPALRFRWSVENWTFGLTLPGSFGTEILPGAAAALAAGWRRGPWRLRVRTSLASVAYRTADGDRPDSLFGGAFDLRVRPASGFQFAWDFSAGRLRSGDFTLDEGRLALGWKWRRWLVCGEVLWDGPDVRPGSIRMEISRQNRHSLTLRGQLDADRTVSLGADAEVKAGRLLSLKPKLSVEVPSGDRAAWSTGLRTTLRPGRHILIIDFDLNDLPDAWRGGPSTVGAGECSVRWIIAFPD